VNDSDTLNATEDPSESQETVTTDADGNFGPEEIWSGIPAGSPMNYDIVVDNQDGVYNTTDDGIDSSNGVVGIVAPIPELATFALTDPRTGYIRADRCRTDAGRRAYEIREKEAIETCNLLWTVIDDMVG
jgi:hypothetical protein